MKTAKETIEYCDQRINEMCEDWDWVDFSQSDLIDLLQEIIDFIDEPSPTQWAIRRLQENAIDKNWEWQRRISGKKWFSFSGRGPHKAIMEWINKA